MKLKDTTLKNAKPREKPYKLFDGGGLYLEVLPAGGKYWRLKYRFGGKENRLALGVYPEVSLADAREMQAKTRELLRKHINPAINRKMMKASDADATANSLEVVAREWLAKFSPNWEASHTTNIKGRLERDVFPWFK